MKKFIRTKWGITVLVSSGFIIIVSVAQLGGFNPLRNLGSVIFSPIQNFFTQSATRVKNFFVYFDDIKNLHDDNQELTERIASLIAENLQLKNEIENNKLAAEEIKFVKDFNYNYVSGRVIGRGSDTYQQVLIINLGTKHKLQPNYPVISGNGILIGKIVETSASSAKVLLLNDNYSQVSGQIQNQELSQGIISGEFGLTLKMDLIPQNDLVSVGDTVTTSGLEQFLPKNIVIGTVKDINKIDGELFQQVNIEPLTNFQDISVITVILPENA